jgi:DNA-binding transcriptional regulator YdaS (Cro superfamily)
MDLHIWLAKKRITKTAFARSLGISRMYLSKICNKYRPSRDLAIKIEELTDGEVSRFQVRPDFRKRKYKERSATLTQMDAFEDL